MYFDRWNTEELLSPVLLPAAEFKPFPAAADRSAWDGISEEIRDWLLAKGKEYLGYPYPMLPAVRYFDFKRNGNRSDFEALYFARRKALAFLVMAECAEYKGRFLDDIVNGIWCICEESTWVLPAHNNMAWHKGQSGLGDVEDPVIDLFAAETGSLLSITRYLLKPLLDQFDPMVERRIRYEVKHRILDPYLFRNDFLWLRPAFNWNTWCTSNCLAAALLMEEEPVRRGRFVLKAMESMESFLQGYSADGGCDEGPNYWGRAGGSLFDTLEWLYNATNGRIDLYDPELVRRIGEFISLTHIQGDYFVNFADAAPRVDLDAGCVYGYGKRIGSSSMMVLAAKLLERKRMEPGMPGLISGDIISLFRLLYLVREYPGMRKTLQDGMQEETRQHWFQRIQVMVAREYTRADQGLYLAAKAGTNMESHNHNDVGNFIVYKNGVPVIIDAGVGVYSRKTFSPERYSIWTMRSSYHNLPTVNGVEQASLLEYRAQNVACSLEENECSLSCDIGTAYPQEAGIVEWNRTASLKRSPQGYIQVEDRFLLKEETKDLFFTLLLASQVEEAGSGFIRTAGARIEFDPSLEVLTESIELDDSKLRQSWGKAIYRVRLKLTEAAKEGCFVLRVI